MERLELLRKMEQKWDGALHDELAQLYSCTSDHVRQFRHGMENFFDNLQSAGLSRPVCFITISQLLTAFWIHGQADFSIRAYDQTLDIEYPLYHQGISFNEIYTPCLRQYHKGLEEIRQYIGSLTPFDVKGYFMKRLVMFDAFLSQIAYYALREMTLDQSVCFVWIGKEFAKYSAAFEQKPVYANQLFTEGQEGFKRSIKEWEVEKLSFCRFHGNTALECAEGFRYRYIWLSHFIGCCFDKMQFNHSLLVQCDFFDCRISDADFSDSCLAGSRFRNCSMTNCRFCHLLILEGYEQYTIDFYNVDLTGAVFEDVDFDNIRFNNVVLQHASISQKWKNSKAFANTQTDGVRWI